MHRLFTVRRVLVFALVATIAAGITFASMQPASAKGEIGLARAIAAQEANNPNILAIDGVVGTGVGAAGNGHGAGPVCGVERVPRLLCDDSCRRRARQA